MTLLTAVQLAVENRSLFKRPDHAHPYIVVSGGFINEYAGWCRFPRLTVEDIAANDWSFIK